MTVGYEEILPVFHHVEGVAECGCETEVVVGPGEALTVSYAEAELVDVFVGVVVVGVVVVVGAVVVAITVEHGVVVVVVAAVVIATADVSLT